MGEIADMMISGDLCEACGTALNGQGYGIPRYCSNECAQDRGFDYRAPDGSGAYRTKKTKGQRPNCFSLRITYDGTPLTKKISYKKVSHDKAKELALQIQKLVEGFDFGK